MYCEYEGSNCPDSEFDVYPTLGRIHVRSVVVIHTIAGDELEPKKKGSHPDPDMQLPIRELESERGE